MSFFSNLNFSSSNEDGRSELAALAGAHRILCVTGSGTRVLDLLMSDAVEVVALDANAAQNALFALKVAAMTRFDRQDYLAFIGLAPSDRRLADYAALRPSLGPAVCAFWDRRPRVIAAGLWHAGRWERLLLLNARLLALYRRRAIDAVMNAETIDRQAQAWQASFAGNRLLKLIETIGRDWVWRVVMREPAGSFLPDARAVGAHLEHAFARAAASFLLRDSDTATLALRGRLRAGDALPLHLRAGNYDRVRSALPKLRIVMGELAGILATGLGRFNGFSLSDFGSYCGPARYGACWKGIVAAAAPGARYCERIFMNEMPPPAGVEIDRALSDRLSAADTAIIYRIRAGTIA